MYLQEENLYMYITAVCCLWQHTQQDLDPEILSIGGW